MREIDEDRLMRLVRPAIPSYEREKVVNSQAEEQQAPFQAAEGPMDLLRINLCRRGVEGTIVAYLLVPQDFRLNYCPAPKLCTNTVRDLIVTGSRRAPQAGIVLLRA